MYLVGREKVTDIYMSRSNGSVTADDSSMSDQEILEFYTLATGRLLTALEVSIRSDSDKIRAVVEQK